MAPLVLRRSVLGRKLAVLPFNRDVQLTDPQARTMAAVIRHMQEVWPAGPATLGARGATKARGALGGSAAPLGRARPAAHSPLRPLPVCAAFQVGGMVLMAPEWRLSLLLKRQELQLLPASVEDAPATVSSLEAMEGMPLVDILDESDELLRHKCAATGRRARPPGLTACARPARSLARLHQQPTSPPALACC